jgi:hypothetical protein
MRTARTAEPDGVGFPRVQVHLFPTGRAGRPVRHENGPFRSDGELAIARQAQATELASACFSVSVNGVIPTERTYLPVFGLHTIFLRECRYLRINPLLRMGEDEILTGGALPSGGRSGISSKLYRHFISPANGRPILLNRGTAYRSILHGSEEGIRWEGTRRCRRDLKI